MLIDLQAYTHSLHSQGILSHYFTDTLALFNATEIFSGGESDTASALAGSLTHAYNLKGTGGGDVHAASEIGCDAIVLTERFARSLTLSTSFMLVAFEPSIYRDSDRDKRLEKYG